MFGREIYLLQGLTGLAGRFTFDRDRRFGREIYLLQGLTGLAGRFTFHRDGQVWQGDLPFTGTDRFGREISPFSHNSMSFLAASSATRLQDRKCSVGRLFRFVQKPRPLQPSWHGSSTEMDKHNS